MSHHSKAKLLMAGGQALWLKWEDELEKIEYKR